MLRIRMRSITTYIRKTSNSSAIITFLTTVTLNWSKGRIAHSGEHRLSRYIQLRIDSKVWDAVAPIILISCCSPSPSGQSTAAAAGHSPAAHSPPTIRILTKINPLSHHSRNFRSKMSIGADRPSNRIALPSTASSTPSRINALHSDSASL